MSAGLELGESLLEAAEYMNKISGKQDMDNEKDSLNAESYGDGGLVRGK